MVLPVSQGEQQVITFNIIFNLLSVMFDKHQYEQTKAKNVWFIFRKDNCLFKIKPHILTFYKINF
jgi:hypothetical protein